MENPYRRIRELTSVNQKDFAAKHGFSRTFMTFVESGQLPDLSPDSVRALHVEAEARGVDWVSILESEYNGQTLADAYHTWQSTERLQAAHQFQGVLPQEGTVFPNVSPFQLFIGAVTGNASAQGFCKLLKVPSTAVTRYARGVTSFMPKAIHDALIEVRYPYLDELEQLQMAWAAAQ